MDFGKLSFVGSKPVNFSLRLKLNPLGIDRNETGILILALSQIKKDGRRGKAAVPQAG
jgi:hypothetical protein